MLLGVVHVAGEDLVAALAVEHDFDPRLARQGHDVPLREDAQRQRRLVQVPDDVLERVQQISRLDQRSKASVGKRLAIVRACSRSS